ncbi:unnamed protein product [Malus baccata var. baccata]
MAKQRKKELRMAKIVNLVSVLSLLLLIAFADAQFLGHGFLKPPPTLKCDKTYGVKSGDTCFGVEQIFNLSTAVFESINPNLNCTRLFVGQWLCLNGSLS